MLFRPLTFEVVCSFKPALTHTAVSSNQRQGTGCIRCSLKLLQTSDASATGWVLFHSAPAPHLGRGWARQQKARTQPLGGTRAQQTWPGDVEQPQQRPCCRRGRGHLHSDGERCSVSSRWRPSCSKWVSAALGGKVSGWFNPLPTTASLPLTPAASQVPGEHQMDRYCTWAKPLGLALSHAGKSDACLVHGCSHRTSPWPCF